MNSAAADPPAWDRLWPLVVTAGLTLVVTLWVQLYVVPRVETRKRRDERWERDLLALGELLTFEQPGASTKLVGTLIWKSALAEVIGDGHDPSKVEHLRTESEREIQSAGNEYRRIDSRVDWLIDRITALDDYSEGLASFRKAHIRYSLAQTQLSGMALLWAGDRSYTANDIQAARDAEHAAVRALVDSIKMLVGHPAPRPSMRRRIRRRLAHGWAPVSRWQARRQVTRDRNRGDRHQLSHASTRRKDDAR